RHARLEATRQRVTQEDRVERPLEDLRRRCISRAFEDFDSLIIGAAKRARTAIDAQNFVAEVLEAHNRIHFVPAKYTYRGIWSGHNRGDPRSVDLARVSVAEPPREVSANLFEKGSNWLSPILRKVGTIAQAVEILGPRAGIEEAEVAIVAPPDF